MEQLEDWSRNNGKCLEESTGGCISLKLREPPAGRLSPTEMAMVPSKGIACRMLARFNRPVIGSKLRRLGHAP